MSFPGEDPASLFGRIKEYTPATSDTGQAADSTTTWLAAAWITLRKGCGS